MSDIQQEVAVHEGAPENQAHVENEQARTQPAEDTTKVYQEPQQQKDEENKEHVAQQTVTTQEESNAHTTEDPHAHQTHSHQHEHTAQESVPQQEHALNQEAPAASSNTNEEEKHHHHDHNHNHGHEHAHDHNHDHHDHHDHENHEEPKQVVHQESEPQTASAGAINETKGDEVNVEKRNEEGETKGLTNLEEVQNTTDKKGKGKKTVDATSDSCKCLIF